MEGKLKKLHVLLRSWVQMSGTLRSPISLSFHVWLSDRHSIFCTSSIVVNTSMQMCHVCFKAPTFLSTGAQGSPSSYRIKIAWGPDKHSAVWYLLQEPWAMLIFREVWKMGLGRNEEKWLSWSRRWKKHQDGKRQFLLLSSRYVMSNSLHPHGLQHASLLCPSLSLSLLKVMSIELIRLSSHLIPCHPLPFCPQSVLASGSFPVSLQWAKVLELQHQSF